MINRKKFFDTVRARLHDGKLSTAQVVGYSQILQVWEQTWDHLPKSYLSYMLATAFHETGATIQPVYEKGSKSYFTKYGLGKLAKMLGNLSIGDGYTFRGRGFVQLTGRRNYQVAGKKLGVDLIKDPDAALDLTNATRILFFGMTEGWFTGKKLRDYDTGLFQKVNARRIINGTDKAALIASYYDDFLDAVN
ncbi:glycoside hydrolase family 19 protein